MEQRALLLGILIVFAGAMGIAAWSYADDEREASLNAKRLAAQTLIRQSKDEEAVFLYKDIAQESNNWQDWAALARLQLRLKNPADAAQAYRKVLDVSDARSRVRSEQVARSEALRQLKVLDRSTGKVRAWVEKSLKEVDELLKIARGEKNAEAEERILRIRGGLFRSDHPRRYYVELRPTGAITDVTVKAGDKYRVECFGDWVVNGRTTDADGYSLDPQSPTRLGRLQYRVRAGDSYVTAGAKGVMTMPHDGRLILAASGRDPKGEHKGTIHVFLERR